MDAGQSTPFSVPKMGAVPVGHGVLPAPTMGFSKRKAVVATCFECHGKGAVLPSVRPGGHAGPGQNMPFPAASFPHGRTMPSIKSGVPWRRRRPKPYGHHSQPRSRKGDILPGAGTKRNLTSSADAGPWPCRRWRRRSLPWPPGAGRPHSRRRRKYRGSWSPFSR